jgi:hypothetical protein
MAERSVEQMNISLEWVEQLSAENTRNLAELQIYVAQVAGTVERIAIATEQRLNKQDEQIARQDQLIRLLSSYVTGFTSDTKHSTFPSESQDLDTVIDTIRHRMDQRYSSSHASP